MPFRTLQRPDAPVVERVPPPAVVAFGFDEALYRVLLSDAAGATAVELARVGGAIRARHAVDTGGGRCVGVTCPGAWALFADVSGELFAWRGAADAPLALGALGRDLAAFAHEGVPTVGAFGRSLAVRAVPARGDAVRVVPAWSVPGSARSLLAMTGNVYGPVAVFATDRDEEVDVCACGHGGAPMPRTVSLGRNQRFESAVGGGTRVLLVSRGPDGLTARTLASDVRSELNPVPIAPRTGWRVGAVRCLYGNGPFVVAHAEHYEAETAVVVTVFDDGATRAVRLLLPGLDALAVDGKDLAIAAVFGGASAPMLIVQRMLLAGGSRRRYVYLLDRPACDTSAQRAAVLRDVAEAIALSLGEAAPSELAVRADDARADVATFALPGSPDRRAFALLVREDGSGIVTVRLGDAPVPPRGLNFVERVRQAVTGDDDGDPRTTRLEVSALYAAIERVVTTVGALAAIG